MMKRMIPSIFYEELRDGLDLFVDCLGFEIIYQDEQFAVVLKENAKVFIVQNAEMAARDRTSLTMETGAIDADFAAVSKARPDFLHPDFRAIQPTPWGGREFAVRDATDVCVMIRQLDDDTPLD